MKIDFVIGSLSAGGAERVVSTLANYFAEKGNSVRIITFRNGDDYELHPSIERIRFHKKFIINYAIVRGFFNLMYFYFNKNNRPEVISSHINLIGYSTIFPALFYNIKLTISEHTNHFSEKVTLPKWFLWNFLYRFSDAITILTEFDLPFFKNKNKTVAVMPNPCSFTPVENLNSRREKVILAVGDLNRFLDKGFDNLMAIGSVILKNNPKWKIKIVGAGDEGIQFLKNEARKFDIEDKVIFTGFRNDINELMSKSEIYILTSLYEGLPMVLIEAMSQGMVCIAYNCISGPSDIITDGVDGILIEDQNKEEMIRQLTELIRNKEQRELLRNNTPKSLDKFSIKQVGQKWDNLFNELV